jgi:hypothetical protein
MPGKMGLDGPVGNAGPPGIGGKQGPPGIAGVEGVDGQEGLSDEWDGTNYDCPSAATATMRLVHCNRKGCRLETLFAGEWGTVCDLGFTEKNAKVLCSAMGYASGGVTHIRYGSGQTAPSRMWLSNVACSGDEGDIADCKHNKWGSTPGCNRDMAVGLCCYGIKTTQLGVRKSPSDFPICPSASTDFARLRSCDYRRCRVEIYHDQLWGTVCDNGFTDTTATVLCRSLGFKEGGVALRAGGGRGKIWLDNVGCKGSETNIEWCPRGPWGRHDCDHNMDAGVCCLGEQKEPKPKTPGPSWRCAGGENTVDNGSTRLVDCKQAACRLEVRHNDEWGTVCSAGFSDKNAKVVCR